MRLSRYLLKTLRETPADADTANHQLMLRAGMVHQVAAGVYGYLPLAWRALQKIERIVREEMDAAGAQEVRLPALHPIELWQESGRAAGMGDILFKVKDRRGHELVLGPTHEEVITDIVRHSVRSYRDLPLILYQIQTKFRDEPRPRSGLLRGREFTMKDAYSFDAGSEGLDRSYQAMAQAYRNIFDRCGLQTIVVEADSGAIGGKDSQEFMVTAAAGEDELLHCPSCGYAANVEKAAFKKLTPGTTAERPPREKVATPGCATIRDVAALLGVPPERTIKAVLYTDETGGLVFVCIRGDLEVNEVKVKNAFKAKDLRPATDAEIRAVGAVPGYASPIGIRREGVKLAVDDSIVSSVDYVTGANQEGYHYRHVFWDRDFMDKDGKPWLGSAYYQDFAKAQPGHGCPKCGLPLEGSRGIEVGHIFKLGTVYSESMGARYLDTAGQEQPIVMGCYGIGVTRILASAIEQHHDEKGIVWPPAIAPFRVYLVGLNLEQEAIRREADALYDELDKAGVEVLYDDREESAGVKFNDADLIGLPVRLTVSPRNVKQGVVEYKVRTAAKADLVERQRILEKLTPSA
ncbi:MAG: proline--tRNA ligase [Dehalococcoidia bacterium]|nr:proline--tRNA ligase [Dehalococcoidia bacterium]